MRNTAGFLIGAIMETALYAILTFVSCTFVAIIAAWLVRSAVCLVRGPDYTCRLGQVFKSREFQAHA